MKLSIRRAALLAACYCASLPVLADNPVIQTRFTADPAPLVVGDTVYLYAGHDEDEAKGFTMRDWRLYSSKDMVNWTDHGAVLDLAAFAWARQDNDAWAAQVIERGGKFYFYASVSVKEGNPNEAIAVAVADSPLGPFKDALGHPLIAPGAGYFDPTVMIDDDGQAYLYWGNPNLWYVKLNKDMVTSSGNIGRIDARPKNYQEGPWVYKRKNRYYLAYASTCCSEGIGYAMSDTPLGPWEYKGQIMDPSSLSTGNHPGIIDFHNKSYVFGFNYRLNFAETPLHRERRSITVAQMDYRADGTIPTLPFWNTSGVEQLMPISPYERVEAETIAWASRIARDRDRPFEWASGVTTERDAQRGMVVVPSASPSFVKVAGVEFGSRAPATFKASLASASSGGKIEVHADAPGGPLVASVDVAATGGDTVWRTQAVKASAISGRHDLFLVFNPSGRDVRFKVDYWRFEH
ncbi:MAG: glycoside hydrolase family 43 protein [Massilia sp.]